MKETPETAPIHPGPFATFFEATGYNTNDVISRVKTWDPGAISLLIAELEWRERHEEAGHELVFPAET